ncbi:hypothetical protein C8J57DRAFT_1237197 [Mycena rebaudengoi]|nr:hypothetical protein C8J57DRAFT_1237197 [Mycena rebaudengoi]
MEKSGATLDLQNTLFPVPSGSVRTTPIFLLNDHESRGGFLTQGVATKVAEPAVALHGHKSATGGGGERKSRCHNLVTQDGSHFSQVKESHLNVGKIIDPKDGVVDVRESGLKGFFFFDSCTSIAAQKWWNTEDTVRSVTREIAVSDDVKDWPAKAYRATVPKFRSQASTPAPEKPARGIDGESAAPLLSRIPADKPIRIDSSFPRADQHSLSNQFGNSSPVRPTKGRVACSLGTTRGIVNSAMTELHIPVTIYPIVFLDKADSECVSVESKPPSARRWLNNHGTGDWEKFLAALELILPTEHPVQPVLSNLKLVRHDRLELPLRRTRLGHVTDVSGGVVDMYGSVIDTQEAESHLGPLGEGFRKRNDEKCWSRRHTTQWECSAQRALAASAKGVHRGLPRVRSN